MARGYGSVIAQGLLGAVMGGAQAAYKNSLEEQKQEWERQKEARLAQLEKEREGRRIEQRTKERAEDRQFQVENFERQETSQWMRESRQADREDTRYERESTRRQQERKEDKEFQADQTQRQIDAQDRRDRERADRDAGQVHTVDAEGNYIDRRGRPVTRSVRIEGRTETLPVKAPKSKVDGKQEVYSIEDQIKAIDKEILVAVRNGDDDGASRLRAEKRRLLNGSKPANFKSASDYIGSVLGRGE